MSALNASNYDAVPGADLTTISIAVSDKFKNQLYWEVLISTLELQVKAR